MTKAAIVAGAASRTAPEAEPSEAAGGDNIAVVAVVAADSSEAV